MTSSALTDLADTDSVLRNFLQDTLKQIMSVVNAEGGSLFIFDPKERELILDTFCNSKNLHLDGLRKRLGEGISGKIAELGKPVLVNNINEDSRFRSNGFKHYQTNSFVSIPLETPCGLVGLINIVDKSNGKAFTEKDLEFAIILSKYACIIVEFLMHSSKLTTEKEDLTRQKQLLEKYASMGKLAAGVVHQINNPLDAIIRFTNIVLEQLDSHTVSKDYIVEIKRGLSRIVNITNSLLEFSHQLNPNYFHFKKCCDVHKVIDESLELLKNKFNGNIIVTKKYKNSLPHVLDLGLQHVIMNIIKNALDAMPNGGVLEILTDVNDCRLEISFKDNGAGIPDETLNHIFEPFFTTKSKEKGSGLGLAMCKEIIERYAGGCIKVKSKIGKGSEFSIILPVKFLKND